MQLQWTRNKVSAGSMPGWARTPGPDSRGQGDVAKPGHGTGHMEVNDQR